MLIAWVGAAATYHPIKHSRLQGLSRMDQVKRINYLGGILSVSGLTILYVLCVSKSLV